MIALGESLAMIEIMEVLTSIKAKIKQKYVKFSV